MPDIAELKAKITTKADSSGIDEATNKVKGFSNETVQASNMVLGAVGAAALAVIAFSASAVGAAESFETKLSNVSTLLDGDVTEAVDGLGDSILKMTRTIPKSADELGAASYDIFSAGISDASQAMLVLESSGKLAVAGLGDTAGATDLMTSSINAFGIDASKSDKISNILFKTVKFGKTTVDQLSQSFGATAPTIAAAGFALEDFQAATAALTTTGLPASQAQNNLRQAIVTLTKPTTEMAALFESLGYDSMEKMVEEGMNMGQIFTMLDKAAGGNAETLTKAWGSVEAYNAALGLSNTVSEAYVDTLADMKSGTDSVNEAFEKQNKTFTNTKQRFFNAVNEIKISVGNSLLPSLASAAEAISENLGPAIASLSVFMEENQGLMIIWSGVIFSMMIPALWGIASSLWLIIAPLLAFAAPFIAVGVGLTLLYMAFQNNFMGIKDLVNGVIGFFTNSVFPALVSGFKIAEVALLVLYNAFNLLWQAMKATVIIVVDYIAHTAIGKDLIWAFGIVKDAVGLMSEDWNNFWDNMKLTVIGAVFIIKQKIKGMVDNVKNLVNGLILKANRVGTNIPGYVEIPMLAKGTRNFKGGPAIVGENGPELVNLPRGANVYSNPETEAMTGATINQTNHNYNDVDVAFALRDLAYSLRNA